MTIGVNMLYTILMYDFIEVVAWIHGRTFALKIFGLWISNSENIEEVSRCFKISLYEMKLGRRRIPLLAFLMGTTTTREQIEHIRCNVDQTEYCIRVVSQQKVFQRKLFSLFNDKPHLNTYIAINDGAENLYQIGCHINLKKLRSNPEEYVRKYKEHQEKMCKALDRVTELFRRKNNGSKTVRFGEPRWIKPNETEAI